jgi:hypothetical protein
MLRITIDKKIFDVRDKLNEYSLSDIITIDKIKPPNLKNKKATVEYFDSLLLLCSNIPEELIKKVDSVWFWDVNLKDLAAFFLTKQYTQPVTSSLYNQLPTEVSGIPMYFTTAGKLCDCIDLFNIGYEQYHTFASALLTDCSDYRQIDILRDAPTRLTSLKGNDIAMLNNYFLTALEYIDSRYKWVLTPPKVATTDRERNAVNKSSLNSFGFGSALFEVVEAGLYSSVNEAKNDNVHDFLTALSYFRASNYYKSIMNDSK